MKRLALLIIPILIWGTSCGKDPQTNEDEAIDDIAYILTPPEPGDVYVAGAFEGKAVLWKNGDTQFLSDGSLNAVASSVFVSAGCVYVAGSIGSNAILWKDGVAQNLSVGAASSVFVSGDDVYVVGNKLWKNGTVQKLTDESDHPGGSSVFVSGNDVYVVGNKLWKNGTVQKLTDGSDHPGGSFVFVSGDDVYVAGTSLGAVVWKNGVAQHLASGYMRSAEANSVFVAGSDVYVTGRSDTREGFRGYLWKNGKEILLSGETTYHSVYVFGDDVYLVGNSIPRSAFLVKNENWQILARGGDDLTITRAFSVFVVEEK